MKEINVYKLSMIKESEVPYKAISCPDDIYDILRSLGLDTAAEEYFYLLCTDSKGHIIGIHEVSHGELSSSIVHPREVFKRALLNNASAILVGHNHPSGCTTPSSEDHVVTERLSEAGKLLGINVLDHIIVGSDDYFSFKKEGLL